VKELEQTDTLIDHFKESTIIKEPLSSDDEIVIEP
jgi:hypothetical protein